MIRVFCWSRFCQRTDFVRKALPPPPILTHHTSHQALPPCSAVGVDHFVALHTPFVLSNSVVLFFYVSSQPCVDLNSKLGYILDLGVIEKHCTSMRAWSQFWACGAGPEPVHRSGSTHCGWNRCAVQKQDRGASPTRGPQNRKFRACGAGPTRGPGPRFVPNLVARITQVQLSSQLAP